jgi:hypothetical protein
MAQWGVYGLLAGIIAGMALAAWRSWQDRRRPARRRRR